MRITHMTTAQDFEQLGQRLRFVRLAAGKSQGSVARALGLDRTAISRMESGERKTNAVELLNAAAFLGVTLADLIDVPTPDVVAARTPLEEESAGNERAHARAQIELDRALRDAEQLRGLGLIHTVDLTFGNEGITSPDHARELAHAARRFLGLGVDPLGPLSDVAASLGLWCRTTEEHVDGLSLTPDSGFGVGLVGAHLEPGRRRSTVAHEIGHHVSGDSSARTGHTSVPAEAERLVDAFAAEFLLPGEVVESLAPCPTRADLIDVAVRYRVSWSVLRTACEAAGKDLAQAEPLRHPTRNDFHLAVGAEPQPDLTPPGLPAAWIRACAQAKASHKVTARRADELARGALT